MDYIEEDYRPRFQVQTSFAPVQSHQHSPSDASVDKKQAALSITVGILFVSYGVISTGVLQILSMWIGISLVLGPFAPILLTGGTISVGKGDPLEDEQEDGDPQISTEIDKKQPKNKSKKHVKPKTNQEDLANHDFEKDHLLKIEKSGDHLEKNAKLGEKNGKLGDGVRVNGVSCEDKEWSSDEIEILRKQLVKSPPGKPGRYEAISQAFSGSRSVESVVKQVKILGEKKDNDPYAKFLTQRKVSDKGDGGISQNDTADTHGDDKGKSIWSSAEDMALLNALKTFPKDVNLRWEKIAASVPDFIMFNSKSNVDQLRKDQGFTTITSHGKQMQLSRYANA